MHRSDNGFFLLDALLSVFIVSALCILCFTIFNLMSGYDEGYQLYRERSDSHYEEIFASLAECEECEVIEPD